MTAQSSLVGKTLGELNLRSSSGASIVAIERNRKFSREMLRPTANTELTADDILLVDLFAPARHIDVLRQQFALEEMPLSGAYFADRSQEIGMVEIIVPPTSDLTGQTLVEAEFRTRFGLTVVGRRRGIAAHRGGLLDEALKTGDTLLLIGPWKDIERLKSDGHDLAIIKLPAELDEVLPAPGKAPQALPAWRSSSA